MRIHSAWQALPATQKGIFCIIGTTLCFAMMDTMAKTMGQRYDPFFVVWTRYVSQAVLTLLIFAPTLHIYGKTNKLGLQIIRSILLFGATCCFFSGFAVMAMVDVIAVAQVVPLIITGLAALVLAEKVGPYRWLGVVFGLIGALIILRPGFSGIGLAVLFPLGGAFFFATYSVATRFLGGADHVWTTFIYTGVAGAVGATIAVPFFWSTPDLVDIPALAFMGVLGGGGQLLLIFAFGYAAASLLAPFLYASMVWAALIGFFIFNEVPDAWTITGACMIVFAGLYVRHRELKRQREAQ
ncbi:MAG: DMT family transporter [Hyphomicrobiales bacterium]